MNNTTAKSTFKKKKSKTILIIIILEFILMISLILFSHIKYDAYKQCYTIKNFSGFTYEMYDDYVVLADYAKNNEHVTITDTFLGKPVTTIGARAFLYLPLKAITLGKNVEAIEADAFCSCTELQEVDGNAELRVIGDGAFMSCTSLEFLSIGNSLISIGEDAFWNCNSLVGQEESFLGNQEHLEKVGEHALDFEGGIYD